MSTVCVVAFGVLQKSQRCMRVGLQLT